jgi:hypothetical protein
MDCGHLEAMSRYLIFEFTWKVDSNALTTCDVRIESWNEAPDLTSKVFRSSGSSVTFAAAKIGRRSFDASRLLNCIFVIDISNKETLLAYLDQFQNLPLHLERPGIL